MIGPTPAVTTLFRSSTMGLRRIRPRATHAHTRKPAYFPLAACAVAVGDVEDLLARDDDLAVAEFLSRPADVHLADAGLDVERRIGRLLKGPPLPDDGAVAEVVCVALRGPPRRLPWSRRRTARQSSGMLIASRAWRQILSIDIDGMGGRLSLAGTVTGRDAPAARVARADCRGQGRTLAEDGRSKGE